MSLWTLRHSEEVKPSRNKDDCLVWTIGECGKGLGRRHPEVLFGIPGRRGEEAGEVGKPRTEHPAQSFAVEVSWRPASPHITAAIVVETAHQPLQAGHEAPRDVAPAVLVVVVVFVADLDPAVRAAFREEEEA